MGPRFPGAGVREDMLGEVHRGDRPHGWTYGSGSPERTPRTWRGPTTFVSAAPKSWYQPEMRGSHVATDSFDTSFSTIDVNPESALSACATALSRTCCVNATPRAATMAALK